MNNETYTFYAVRKINLNTLIYQLVLFLFCLDQKSNIALISVMK